MILCNSNPTTIVKSQILVGHLTLYFYFPLLFHFGNEVDSSLMVKSKVEQKLDSSDKQKNVPRLTFQEMHGNGKLDFLKDFAEMPLEFIFSISLVFVWEGEILD